MNDFIKFAKDLPNLTTTELEDYQKFMDRCRGMQMNHAYEVFSQAVLPTNMTPNIVEESEMRIAVMDVFSRLVKDRIIFLGTGIDSQVSNIIVGQMLYLQNVDSKSDINLYIASGGGEIYSGLSILSTMANVSCDVATMTTSIAASMAYVLATAGANGKRSALPYARFMQHQPLGGTRGQATDINISTAEINKLKHELYEIIAHCTGKDIEQIYADCERDHWMRADEAKDYGVIDIVQPFNMGDFSPSPMSDKAWKKYLPQD